MDTKPLSVSWEIGEHFYRDAVDFANRFDLLWEAGPLMGKTGRTKSFIDLLMGCECALKSHCFLSHQGEDPRMVFGIVRRAGHKIDRLANYASCLTDRAEYDFLKSQLGDFPVELRYSMDASRKFFPDLKNRDRADLNYSQTIGNDSWVMQIRLSLERLNAFSATQFQGFVTTDIEEIFAHYKSIEIFNRSIGK